MVKNFNRRRFVFLLAALPGAGLLAACGEAVRQTASVSTTGVAAVPGVTNPPPVINSTLSAVVNSTPVLEKTATTGATNPVSATQTVPPSAVPPTALPSTPVPARPASNLPNRGPAPDFNNTNWLNSAPLKLADLRGKVVMVEFWTFGCVNCQNVIPSLRDLYADFSNKGFTIVSMHAPEFDYEKKWENVQEAVKRLDIKYPVAQDNDFATWGKYRINAWPTLVLLDKSGNLRYQHIGEGAYEETRAAVQALLAE